MKIYHAAMLYVFIGLLGLCIGSFLNVVIYRVPNKISLVKPDSHCPVCKNKIKKKDNIPLFSYFALGGKCRSCGAAISPRYPAVEFANMMLWLISLRVFGGNDIRMAVIGMGVSSILLCVALTDLENMWIPDGYHLILLALGIAAAAIGGRARAFDAVVGCVCSLLFFLMLFYGTKLFLKREGLGGGDVKLMAAAGFLLGWRSACVATFIGTVSACIVMLPLSRHRGDGASREFPFAPFLSLGILVAFFAGDAIMNAYLGLFGL